MTKETLKYRIAELESLKIKKDLAREREYDAYFAYGCVGNSDKLIAAIEACTALDCEIEKLKDILKLFGEK